MESDKFKSHLPYCSFFRLYGCRGSVESRRHKNVWADKCKCSAVADIRVTKVRKLVRYTQTPGVD
jgi:hypothetical protein